MANLRQGAGQTDKRDTAIRFDKIKKHKFPKTLQRNPSQPDPSSSGIRRWHFPCFIYCVACTSACSCSARPFRFSASGIQNRQPTLSKKEPFMKLRVDVIIALAALAVAIVALSVAAR
jgi:hypothetical protein